MQLISKDIFDVFYILLTMEHQVSILIQTLEVAT